MEKDLRYFLGLIDSYHIRHEEAHRMYYRNGVQRHYKPGVLMANKVILTNIQLKVCRPSPGHNLFLFEHKH